MRAVDHPRNDRNSLEHGGKLTLGKLMPGSCFSSAITCSEPRPFIGTPDGTSPGTPAADCAPAAPAC